VPRTPRARPAAPRSFARPVLADTTTPFANAAEVRLGARTACARKTDGSVWCWGQNSSGEVPGHGDLPVSYPVQVPLPGSGDQAISIRLISVADFTWCSVMKDTSVVCWGSNYAGEAGVPSPYPGPAAPPTRISWR
jgi:alpha-tubulin suppressor-like RCC1 family protein